MGLRDRVRRLLGKQDTDPVHVWVRIALVVCVLAFGMAMGRFAQENTVVRQVVAQYGYLGVFFVALVSGFNIIVPIPAVAFIPMFAASGLDLAVTIAVIVVGVTIADMLAFSLGHVGSDLHALRESRIVRKMRKVRERHYWWPLMMMFVYACVAPLPNEVLAIPLGMMKYPWYHVAPPLLLGNLVFNSFATFGIMTLFAAIR